MIPHAHFIDAYPNHVSREEARRRLGLERDAFVHLFFGNLRGYKALPELVDAFERIGDERTRLPGRQQDQGGDGRSRRAGCGRFT